MAQQLLNVGTGNDTRDGDTWRAAMIKVNSNETELFTLKAPALNAAFTGTMTLNGFDVLTTNSIIDADTLDGLDSTDFARLASPSDFTTAPTIGGGAIALIDSPAFINTPTAPTATPGDNSSQLATTSYVDTATSAAQAGLKTKGVVRLLDISSVTSVNSTPVGAGVGKTITMDVGGAITIDGVLIDVSVPNTNPFVIGDRIVVNGYGAGPLAIHNGIYDITTLPNSAGPVAMVLTRSVNFDASPSNEVTSGSYVFVIEGVDYNGTGWALSDNATLVGGEATAIDLISELNFDFFKGTEHTTASGGITKTGNDFALTDSATPGNLLVANSSNKFTDVAVTGDVTMSDSGVVDIIDNVSLGGAPTVDGNIIWHAGNDGAGSGLDADTLDGLDSSIFPRLTANVFTGIQTIQSVTPRLEWIETDGGLDAKKWEMFVSAERWILTATNDANNNGQNVIEVDRAGFIIGDVNVVNGVLKSHGEKVWYGDDVVIVRTAADWPATLLDNTSYFVVADITIPTTTTLGTGCAIYSDRLSTTITYLGAGSMFVGVDVGACQIHTLAVTAPNAQIFDISDTVPLTSLISIFDFTINICAKYGTFDSLNIVSLKNVIAVGADGYTVSGINAAVFVTNTLTMIGTAPTYIGFDFGTTILNTIFLDKTEFNVPLGGVGISGLAGSGNVTAGNVANVKNARFDGGMITALVGITTLDVRWAFVSVTGGTGSLIDSLSAGSTYLVSSTTSAISTIGVFVPIDGVNWVDGDTLSRFTANSAGVLTFIGEYALNVNVICTCTVEKVGGGADIIHARLNVGGVGNVESTSVTQSSNPSGVVSVANIVINPGDEVYVEVANLSTTTDIITLRANLIVTQV